MKLRKFPVQNLDVILQILLSYIGTCGICYLFSLAGMEHASFGIMTLMLMPALYLLFSHTRKNLKERKAEDPVQYKRRIRYAFVLSFLFSVSMIIGYQLQKNGMTECGFKGKSLILLRGACLAAAVFPFANFLFQGMEQIGTKQTESRQICGQKDLCSQNRKLWKSGKLFAVCSLVIFACLIPVWLAYYPIIMSYDFHRQINEAVNGFIWFVQYQPLAHTWVIWLFLQLGRLLNNLEAGMAGMALLHMLLYSLVASYACTFLYRILRKKWCVVLTAAFFCLFPLNTVLVVCTTKDVIFSSLFLLFFLLLSERNFFSTGKKRLILEILLLLEGCVMMQFRSNAIHAIAVFSILWVIFAARKEKLRILLLCILLVAGGRGTAAAVKAALGTQLGISGAEMCSVPIQQFTRVGHYHGDELDPDTWEMLNSYVPEHIWEDYYPAIADSAKANVAGIFADTWEGNWGQVFSDWLALGLRYPNEYIDAFLELTRGYWFWDDRSYAECLGYGLDGRMGIIYTYYSSSTDEFDEIRHDSKFPWLEQQLEKIISRNDFYNWPVISVLFKSAFYFWELLLLFTACFYLRRKQLGVLILLPLVYMGTMLLGPVVQLRYVFPIMVISPVLIALLFMGKTTDK